MKNLIWLCWVAGTMVAQDIPFHYTVRVDDPTAEKWHVTLTMRPIPANQSFYIPAWSPGSYRMCHFGKWVDSLVAFDENGLPLKVLRKNWGEWYIVTPSKTTPSNIAKISYVTHDIPEDSLETLPTTLNEMAADYFFFNGPTMFGYFKDQKAQKYRVTYQLPKDWNVWCSLDSAGASAFDAVSYDELIDSPVIAGGQRIRRYDFDVNQTRYVMIVNSETPVAMDSIITISKPIIEYQTNFFGEAPFSRYMFLFNFFTSGKRFGALEHASSSAYYVTPPINQNQIRPGFYSRVIAHEFFHLWNPKRIYSSRLFPFQYQEPIKIQGMWFIEGVTEYYAKLTLVRAGILPPAYLYHEMRTIAQENFKDNLETLSLRAYEVGVAPVIYTKGALVGLFLDIELRDRSQNQKSLDDVVRYCNTAFAHNKKGYDDRQLTQVVKDATGIDVKSFYKKYIAGTNEMPNKDYFKKAGLLYEVHFRPYLGWYLDIDDNSQLFVSSVSGNSTASSLKLQNGDIIRSINRKIVPGDADSVRSFLSDIDKMKVGETIRMTIERDGKSMDLKGPILPGTVPDVILTENPNASPKEIAIRNGILGIQ